jgi:predicted nucleotidyltransferase
MNQLAHLPVDKQREIAEIVEVIKDVAEPEKIILYGSFARGNWVDDEYVQDGITYAYRSDFDFIVVTNGSRLKEFEIKSKINNRTKVQTSGECKCS